MNLYRGENNKVSSFSITEGNNTLLTESGPGIYFYNYEKRNSALAYAVNNSDALFNEDMDEDLEKGYFYSCTLLQTESRLLNQIPAIEIKDYLEDMVDNILDNNEYDYGFLRIFHEADVEAEDDDDLYYKEFLISLSQEDNVSDVIIALHEILKVKCNLNFVSSIIPTLIKIGSFATETKNEGEIVVYNPDAIKIDSIIEVTLEDIKKNKKELPSSDNSAYCG